jgi:hypothetical protein
MAAPSESHEYHCHAAAFASVPTTVSPIPVFTPSTIQVTFYNDCIMYQAIM